MTVILSFMEIVSIVAMLLAGAFTVLKLAGSQFIRSIGSKFAEIESDMKKQAGDLNSSMDSKFNGFMLSTRDRIELEATKIRLASEERHSAYLEKFSTKDDLIAISLKNDKRMDDIFDSLRRIEDKVANNITREEFNTFKAKQ